MIACVMLVSWKKNGRWMSFNKVFVIYRVGVHCFICLLFWDCWKVGDTLLGFSFWSRHSCYFCCQFSGCFKTGRTRLFSFDWVLFVGTVGLLLMMIIKQDFLTKSQGCLISVQETQSGQGWLIVVRIAILYC